MSAGALCNAVLAGKIDVVANLIDDQGVNVNDVHLVGRTALHSAARAGRVEVARYLIEKGADVNHRDEKGMTPLMLGILHGRDLVCKELLDSEADPNAKDTQQWTAMHWAASTGRTLCMVMLQEYEGDCDPVDNEGRSPLHRAAVRDHSDVISHLIQSKAEVNRQDHAGNTPLALASSAGNVTAVKVLLENGADPEIRDFIGRTAQEKAQETGQTHVVRIFKGKLFSVNSFRTRVTAAMGLGNLMKKLAGDKGKLDEEVEEVVEAEDKDDGKSPVQYEEELASLRQQLSVAQRKIEELEGRSERGYDDVDGETLDTLESNYVLALERVRAAKSYRKLRSKEDGGEPNDAQPHE